MWGEFMKNILKISMTAFVAAAYIPCSAMMILFNKKNDDHHAQQRLPMDLVAEVGHRAPDQTKLQVRATCREMEKRIQIEDLKNARLDLMGRRIFYIDLSRLIYDRYLNGDFTQARADELGWKYKPTAFTADGILVRNDQGEVEWTLYKSAFGHHYNSDDGTLYERNYQDLKRAFSLADKIGDVQAQKDIMHTLIPNNDNGLRDVYGMGIVRSAIFRKDWKFAQDLIKANPHGFSGRRDNKTNPALPIHVKCSHASEIGIEPHDKNLQKLVKLSDSQPYYYEKNHEHCTIL